MANFCRLVFMVLAIVVVTLVAAAEQPEWANDLHLNGRWLSGAYEDRVLADNLDKAIQRRICEKEWVLKELLDGRLTLFEAADQFQRLDEADPKTIVHPRYLEYSKDERACRQVIEWVRRGGTAEHRESADSRAAQFEEELRRHKEAYHKVSLRDALQHERPAPQALDTE